MEWPDFREQYRILHLATVRHTSAPGVDKRDFLSRIGGKEGGGYAAAAGADYDKLRVHEGDSAVIDRYFQIDTSGAVTSFQIKIHIVNGARIQIIPDD